MVAKRIMVVSVIVRDALWVITNSRKGFISQIISKSRSMNQNNSYICYKFEVVVFMGNQHKPLTKSTRQTKI